MPQNKEQTKFPWVETVRRESGLIEHVCKHDGIGHPVFASVDWMELHGRECMDVHGCDGCCRTPEWQIASLQESVKVANRVMQKQHAIITKAGFQALESNRVKIALETEILKLKARIKKMRAKGKAGKL